MPISSQQWGPSVRPTRRTLDDTLRSTSDESPPSSSASSATSGSLACSAALCDQQTEARPRGTRRRLAPAQRAHRGARLRRPVSVAAGHPERDFEGAEHRAPRTAEASPEARVIRRRERAPTHIRVGGGQRMGSAQMVGRLCQQIAPIHRLPGISSASAFRRRRRGSGHSARSAAASAAHLTAPSHLLHRFRDVTRRPTMPRVGDSDLRTVWARGRDPQRTPGRQPGSPADGLRAITSDQQSRQHVSASRV